jgi:hypothetical protein
MELTTAQLVEQYNAAATELNKPLVKRFSDRKTAVRRTEEIRKELAEVLRKLEHKQPSAEGRKVRQPVFRFQHRVPEVNKRSTDSLRARCEELLSGEGATFAEVETLVREFDAERKKPSKNVKQRAYGLIRIMHYQLGHGLDDRDGRIKLVRAQGRLV